MATKKVPAFKKVTPKDNKKEEAAEKKGAVKGKKKA